jgi:hypothetical protein
MISLSDTQLDIVMNVSRDLPPEKRNTFLERVVAQLQRRGRMFNDADVGAIAQQALHGLVQPMA